MALQQGGHVPLAVQLASIIREYIYKGIYKTGSALPSEPRLAREFGVSRETARTAVRLLRDEGLIVTRNGRGSYVQAGQAPVIIEAPPGTTIRARLPDATERERTGTPEGAPVLVITLPGQQDDSLADSTRAIIVTTSAGKQPQAAESALTALSPDADSLKLIADSQAIRER